MRLFRLLKLNSVEGSCKNQERLDRENRRNVRDLLNKRLAEAIDLKTQTKHAHWNVKGPNFIALHELFDQVAATVEEYGDLIAERIVQLGRRAEGTSRGPTFGPTGIPLDIVTGPEHIEALAKSRASFGKSAREPIDQTIETWRCRQRRYLH